MCYSWQWQPKVADPGWCGNTRNAVVTNTPMAASALLICQLSSRATGGGAVVHPPGHTVTQAPLTKRCCTAAYRSAVLTPATSIEPMLGFAGTLIKAAAADALL